MFIIIGNDIINIDSICKLNVEADNQHFDFREASYRLLLNVEFNSGKCHAYPFVGLIPKENTKAACKHATKLIKAAIANNHRSLELGEEQFEQFVSPELTEAFEGMNHLTSN